MLVFPDINPVAFSLGPLAVHWYGLSYLAGIGLGWWLLQCRAASGAAEGWSATDVADVVFYAAIGAVLGGRVGYTLFYNFAEYAEHPLEIFKIWQGGMSFHGGVLGFILALVWYARRTGRRFFGVADFVIGVVPIGLGLGRVANFINQELWGAPTALPWAVVFTNPAAGAIARHPSQLYEALLEGLVLFFVLSSIAKRKPQPGVISAVFLMSYGLIRCGIEFVREPDQQLGYLAWGWVTMGQLLSLPMIIMGAGIFIWSTRPAHATTGHKR